MTLMDKIKEKAKSNKKMIVLAEGTEPRVLKATETILKEGIADITLLGNKDDIKKAAAGLDISKANIVDPENSDNYEKYSNEFFELRKKKGMTPENAKKIMKDVMYYGAMMVKMGDADGMVAGSIHTTGDLLRPAFQIIKTAPGTSIVSSCFIMTVPNKDFGQDGVLVFADCAVNPNPDASQLASIAVTSAKTAQTLAGIKEPNVALLSFSTKGSAKNELVDKVAEATKLAKEMAPELNIDGELQADAALVESVGKLKAQGSTVAGKANVLVFPDLQAGNIGYKLVQRFANAQAIGPICQGIAKPVNDLSRGCSADDIVGVVAITSVQAQA